MSALHTPDYSAAAATAAAVGAQFTAMTTSVGLMQCVTRR